MKVKYLLPYRFKKIGWAILVPAAILGIIYIFFQDEPSFFDFNVPAIWVDEIWKREKVFGFTNNNIFNEIVGVLTIIGLLIVAFAKEKTEDEYISKIRLESLVWATYTNYIILLLAFISIYDFSFFWVMVVNMFTTLVFFVIHFNWKLYKFKTLTYEK